MSERLKLWKNARLATCGPEMEVIEQGAMMSQGAQLAWVGEEASLPTSVDGQDIRHAESYDLRGAWVTPGLIDCHTHLVFAGTRAEEYSQRLRGVSYEQIARGGGGILSTVRAVRGASGLQLFDESVPRLQALIAEGVTTVEIKSGYGLTLADEIKMLQTARALGRAFPVTVSTTMLAAHTVPPEFSGSADSYIDAICREWLPAIHEQGLIDAVDVFCDSIAFDARQAERLFHAAQKLDLPVKMHAEQLSNIGGTQLATRFNALSCDHLEYATKADAEALADSGTVAVLLPVAFYSLAAAQKPPVRALRAAGAAMAIATDCNPGSSPTASLLLAMSMATRLFGLRVEEVLAAVTRHAARAAGVDRNRGTLAAGYAADFAIWDVRSLDELGYWTGFNPCRGTVKAGEFVTPQASRSIPYARPVNGRSAA
jgi:imidazolonepropionase